MPQVDRNYIVTIDHNTLTKVRAYLAKIKTLGVGGLSGVVGYRLEEVLGHYLYDEKDDAVQKKQQKLANLTLEQFLEILLNTKKPKAFAEDELDVNNNEWNAEEIDILEYVGFAVPVDIYDEGQHGDHPTIHTEPFKGNLLYIPGPVLVSNNRGLRSYDEIVKDGRLDQEAANKMFEERLLPLFIHANNQAASKGKRAVITIPGISCGFFGGEFGNDGDGSMAVVLRNAIGEILKTHKDKLKNIGLVYFDPFKLGICGDSDENIDGIKFRTRPALGGANRPAQLCHPSKYQKEGEDFRDCELFSFVAADSISWPGNDMMVDSKATDEGVKTGATNALAVVTGVGGRYERHPNFGPSRYKSDSYGSYGQMIAHQRIKLEAVGKVRVLQQNGVVQPLSDLPENNVEVETLDDFNRLQYRLKALQTRLKLLDLSVRRTQQFDDKTARSLAFEVSDGSLSEVEEVAGGDGRSGKEKRYKLGVGKIEAGVNAVNGRFYVSYFAKSGPRNAAGDAEIKVEIDGEGKIYDDKGGEIKSESQINPKLLQVFDDNFWNKSLPKAVQNKARQTIKERCGDLTNLQLSSEDEATKKGEPSYQLLIVNGNVTFLRDNAPCYDVRAFERVFGQKIDQERKMVAPKSPVAPLVGDKAPVTLYCAKPKNGSGYDPQQYGRRIGLDIADEAKRALLRKWLEENGMFDEECGDSLYIAEMRIRSSRYGANKGSYNQETNKGLLTIQFASDESRQEFCEILGLTADQYELEGGRLCFKKELLFPDVDPKQKQKINCAFDEGRYREIIAAKKQKELQESSAKIAEIKAMVEEQKKFLLNPQVLSLAPKLGFYAGDGVQIKKLDRERGEYQISVGHQVSFEFLADGGLKEESFAGKTLHELEVMRVGLEKLQKVETKKNFVASFLRLTSHHASGDLVKQGKVEIGDKKFVIDGVDLAKRDDFKEEDLVDLEKKILDNIGDIKTAFAAAAAKEEELKGKVKTAALRMSAFLKRLELEDGRSMTSSDGKYTISCNSGEFKIEFPETSDVKCFTVGEDGRIYNYYNKQDKHCTIACSKDL